MDADHWLRSELYHLQAIRRLSHHTLPQNREIERAWVCPWRNEALTHLMPFICQSQPSALHPSFCGVASRAAVCSQRSSRRLDSVHSKYLDRLKCLWFISDLSSVRSACCVRLCREHTYTSPENWDTAARDTAAGPDTRQYLTHKQTRTTWCYNSVRFRITDILL